MTAFLWAPSAAPAAEPQCVRILWGDGRHDDTAALNAWLRGVEAVWAENGLPVGPTISGRKFRLSSAIYVRSGTGRTLHDFRLEWPERGEVVTGGTIAAGADPDKPPRQSAISIAGGDPGEGVPYEAPDPGSHRADIEAGCAIS